MASPAPPPMAWPLIALTIGLRHAGESQVELHRQLGAILRRQAGAELLELGEVRACAEPLPRAGQHDGADRIVGVGGPQRIEQSLRQLGVERVALLRAVHGEDADRAAVFDQQAS